MYSQYYTFKPKAVVLRKKGRTYGEIKRIIGEPIPKSTFSHWFRNIIISEAYKRRLDKNILKNIQRAQVKALVSNRLRREKYIQEVRNRVKHLIIKLRNRDTAKIALAMLFLGEGAKRAKGSVMFGNSDPKTVELFLKLLRYSYKIDESKFRCTLQCRADQNIKKLEKFWSRITNIPFSQFYKARVDLRTIGKPSKRLDYKGVCRIDYFSGDIFMELKQIIEVITRGL